MAITAESELTPAGRRVLCLRYGLGDGVVRKLRDVGQACGHSKEWARQVEIGAMRRLFILARAYRDGAVLSPTQRADLITYHPACVAWVKTHP